MQRVDTWLKRLAVVLWPRTCVLCGAAAPGRSLDLCEGCEADLPLNGVACSICAEPLSAEPGASLICGSCLRRKPAFDVAYCPFQYAYPLDHLVQGIKYHRAVAQGQVLSELLAAHLRTLRCTAPLPEILVPVPLASKRYRQRGYNQAIELGRCVEKHLQVRMRTDLVIRTRETREQASLDKRERRRNIRDAFTLIHPLSERHVAIIDDVVTTGSTVNELAKLLKRSGAARVEVWAVARAANAKSAKRSNAAQRKMNSSAIPTKIAMPK
jgi:ComF family protein